GELTHGQQLVHTIRQNAPLTPAAAWNIAGHSAAKVDGRNFVTGKHQYTSDLKRPGLQYGKILRPPAFDAKLLSLDDSAARQIPGVTVMREGDLCGVAAPDQETAERALAALKHEWKTEPQPSDRELFAYLKAHAEP